MHMRIWWLITGCVAVNLLYGQQPSNTRSYLQNQYALERLSNMEQLVMGTVRSLPMAPPDVLGNDRLNNSFNQTLLLLNDSSLLKGVLARYYVLSDEFELKTSLGVRILKGERVKSFIWTDSASQKTQVFINMKEYLGENGVPGKGFMQILSDGKIALLKHTEVIFKPANYHAALNVGTRDHQFIHKTQLYYLHNGRYQRVPPRNKVLAIFPDQKEKLQSFVKVNQLNLSDEYHLQLLFDYYNNLK
jgi:hypothetical protein